MSLFWPTTIVCFATQSKSVIWVFLNIIYFLGTIMWFKESFCWVLVNSFEIKTENYSQQQKYKWEFQLQPKSANLQVDPLWQI